MIYRLLAVLPVVCAGTALADPPQTVIVDNPGEGGVNATYRIGYGEVTNDEYADFLNAVAAASDTYGLWNSGMKVSRTGSGPYSYAVVSGYENRPIQNVTWFNTIRFVNWLDNGMPAAAAGVGVTETGAYDIDGTAQPWPNLVREPNAHWFLPTDAERRKAAKWSSTNQAFWTYATQSNSAPTPATVDSSGFVTNAGQSVVNYDQSANWDGSTTGNVTVVGDCGSFSPYGAVDMDGNVAEWAENLYVELDENTQLPIAWFRNSTAGSYGSPSPQALRLESLNSENVKFVWLGFRVGARCLADFNGDGVIDFFDYDDFMLCFEEDDCPDGMTADINRDSGVDFFDWDAFVAAYEEGC